jgi:hypothetical protein
MNSIRWWELEKSSTENVEESVESVLRFSTIYIVLQEGEKLIQNYAEKNEF